jgi:phosphoglucomutase/phosphomannomutase
MVSASHNPPSDNAVKVYWSSGGQLLPPHDQGVIERVMATTTIHRTLFSEGLAEGQIVLCQDETDEAFFSAVLAQAQRGPRDLKILYSPLHGVGATAVLPVLERDGFGDVELFAPHAEPNGDFPNVPDHVSNPENPAVFAALIAYGQQTHADLAVATDPDCDRIGLAAPLTLGSYDAWGVLTGNQIGSLLTEFVLESLKVAGRLKREHFIVSTLVTTQLTRRIAEAYGVACHYNLHVGFKNIAGMIDRVGPENFLYATEESHGYMAGNYGRDKDGVVASMLAAEMAAHEKAAGRTLHEKLDALYWQFGYHGERQLSVMLPGSDGMLQMAALMDHFRSDPPRTLAGMQIVRVRDYHSLTDYPPGGSPRPLDAPPADMVILDLDQEGCYVAVRPSGTEPKIKFYMFVYEPAEQIADLESTKAMQAARLDALARDLAVYAEMG